MLIKSREDADKNMTTEFAIEVMLDYFKDRQDVDCIVRSAAETLVNYVRKGQLNRQKKYERLKELSGKTERGSVGRPKKNVNLVSLTPEVQYTCEVYYLRSSTYVYCSAKYIMLVLHDLPVAAIRSDGMTAKIKTVYENDVAVQDKIKRFLRWKSNADHSLTVSELESLRDKEFDLSCPRITKFYRKDEFYRGLTQFCADNNYEVTK